MVENLSLNTIQNKVEKGYEKYDDGLGGIKYSQELWNGCKDVINEVTKKVKKGFENIKNKEKLNSDYQKKLKIFQEQRDKTLKEIEGCCNSWSYVKRSHKDRLNKLAGWIDNYENSVVKVVNELINQDNELQGITAKEKEIGKNYFSVKDGVYTLTKDVNAPKIHEVFGDMIKPGETWVIDYSGCRNSAIKSKMLNTMGSYSCYLHYDKKNNTYVVTSGKIQEGDNGVKNMGVSTQRALIREGVKIVPNSKVKQDAKVAIKNRTIKEANKELTNDAKNDLKKIVPKKLSAELGPHRDEFFRVTEKNIKERIKSAKSAGYELAGNICSKKGYTKNGSILEIHLIQGSTEAERPLLTDKFSPNLFDILDDHEGDLVTYMKVRIPQLWNQLDYATKHETVVTGKELGSNGVTEQERKQSNQMKNRAIYGLGLLGTLIDNLIDAEGNSLFDNDDKRLADCKKYVRDVLYSLENTDIVTKENLNIIKNTLTAKLWPFYQAKGFDHRGRGLTFSEKGIRDQLNNVIFGASDVAQKGIRTLGAGTTVFDNEQTTFLRDEIIQNADKENVALSKENNEWADACFQHIKDYSISEDDIKEENGKIVIDVTKKGKIDKLYEAAASDADLLEYFKANKLLPKHAELKDKEIKSIISTIRTTLNTRKSNIEKTISQIDVKSVKDGLKQRKLQLESSNNLSDDELRELNYLNCIIDMEDSYFNKMIEDEKEKMEILKYQGLDDTLGVNLTPWLAKKAGGIQGVKNADIFNDSIGAGGAFDRSDENCAKIGPILQEIIIEVVVTAVSIALSWTGAGEAIYTAYRFAKLASSAAKGVAKMIKFMTSFTKALGKITARQFAGKFAVRAAKASKTVNNASHIYKGVEGVRGIEKVKNAYQTIKATETFGSLSGKLAMKGTSMLIEGTTFHINSTLIHNAINGSDLSEGLKPFDYIEGPNGEKIPNRRSYAQSIAFLGVLKTLGKPIQSVTGDVGKFLNTKLSNEKIGEAISYILGIGGEMGSMMGTDQILSLTFDGKFKEVTGEDLITMIGMVAGLRLTNKVNMKIQEYDRKSVTVEMKKGENTFDVKIDRDGNVLKIEGKDANGRKISNPETALGIKSKVDGENLRNTRAGQEVGTIEGNIRELGNLHEGDIITVKHGEKDVKLKKNKNGNWEITDAGGIEGERFKLGEEYIVNKNPDSSGYHLESKIEGGPKITLDGRVKVQLKGREVHRPGETVDNEGGNSVEQQSDMLNERNQELLRQKQELLNKKEIQNNRKIELEKKKMTLKDKRNELLKKREENRRSLDNLGNNINQITEILSHDNIITIDGVKYKYNKIKNGKAEFVIENEKLGNPNTVEISSLSELLDSRFNLEPGKKGTNGGRYDKLHKLLNDKVEPLDRLQNKIRNKTTEVQLLVEEVARLEKGNNTVAHNDYFALHKQELVGKKVRINGVKYSSEHVNSDGTIQFKQVDGTNNFTISSFEQLAKKGQVNGFSDGLLSDGSPRKQTGELNRSERENHELIRNLISGEKDYITQRDVSETLKQKKIGLQTAQQELEGLESKLPASRARQQAIDERAQRGREINKELREVEDELNKVERDLGESDRLVKKYQDEIDKIEKEIPKQEKSQSELESEQEKFQGRDVDINRNREIQENETGIEKPEDVEKKIDEMFSKGNRGDVKFDWVKQKIFETGVFIEGVHRRFNNLSLKPNIKIPKEFLRKLKDSIIDMKNRWGEKLSEYYRKLVDKRNKYLERRIVENGDEVEIKEDEIKDLETGKKESLYNSMGSDLHEKWRKKRLKDDGTYEPQIEKTKDIEWIRRNGTNKVDLANTKFEDLPSDWKKENLKAAEVAIDLVYEKLSKGKEITPQILEEMSKIVHNKRLERNGIEGSFENQRVSYEKLSESEKAKDRDQILQAIEKIGGREKRYKIEENFNERQKREKQQRKEREGQERKIGNERPERGINTERREMSEVHRNSDVVAIGDLHGEYVALKGNMEYAGLAKEVKGHLERTGGNKKVVFQGDILGDRGTDSFRIIKEIHQLREQARKQGGDIDIIVGNHDDFLISFLTQRGGAHLSGIELANHPLAPTQGLGLTELAKFVRGEVGDFDIIRGQQFNILKAMRESSEGRLILEEICNMKLVSQVDDVLYIHTNPTDAMLKFLTNSRKGTVQQMINSINSKYQNYLRIMLLGEGSITSQGMKEFNGLSDLFLNTDNRTTSQKLDYYKKLRNSGINMISHGHSGGSAIPENIVDLGDWNIHYLYEGNQASIGGVKIVDTDYSYGKRGRTGGQHSVSVIKKEGGVNYIGDNIAYANLEYPIGTEVYVKRTAGGESKAKVKSYNPNTKEYLVVWEEGGQALSKEVTAESLRKNKEQQEEQQRRQQEEQQRRQQEEQQRRQQEEQQRRQQEEQQRRQQEEQQRRQQEEQQRRQQELEKKIQNNNERPKRGINTERREMSEVHRNSDVVAIGDLHGEYVALKGNMEYAGLAKEVKGHLERTGGNKKVVFQGDILADRGTDGLRIIQEIHQLREQARKQGGDIDIIVGNHDDFMISYLTGRNGTHGDGLRVSTISNQGKGLTELLNFIGVGREGGFSDFIKLEGKNREILETMMGSPEGRIILEEICNMKLVSQVDDVLYCHTNPTDRMMELLTTGKYNGDMYLYHDREGNPVYQHVDVQISSGNTTIQENIDIINNAYQGFLRKTLLGENINTVSENVFNGISDIFLNTSNRNNQMSLIGTYCNQLKNSGINMISHGHNGGSGYRSTEIGGVKIVDTDHTFMKKGSYDAEGHSISIVTKEGGANYVGDNVAYANLEYPLGTEVYVKRTAGGESRAKVESYNSETKEYKVVWNEGGGKASKIVSSDMLRKAA